MILSEAYKWISLGIAVVPILLHSKRPAIPWKRYQSELPGPVDLIRWFQDGSHNLAVVCGWQNLVVLDFDTLTAYDKFASEHSDLLNTYSVLTNRGKHLYYFCDNPPKQRGLEGIDVKSGGYVLAPPSIHPSGKRYEVERGGEIMTIKRLPVPPSTQGVSYTVNNYGSIGSLHQTVLGGNDLISQIKCGYSIVRLFPPVKLTGDGLAFARCPMDAHPNGDRDPSLSLDLINNRCQCISRVECPLHSPRGNDVIDAYQILHSLPFRQALAEMANELGL